MLLSQVTGQVPLREVELGSDLRHRGGDDRRDAGHEKLRQLDLNASDPGQFGDPLRLPGSQQIRSSLLSTDFRRVRQPPVRRPRPTLPDSRQRRPRQVGELVGLDAGLRGPLGQPGDEDGRRFRHQAAGVLLVELDHLRQLTEHEGLT